MGLRPPPPVPRYLTSRARGWPFALAPTLNPQPSTLNPQPSTLNPQPSTLNPQPSTLNPQPSTRNPQPSTLNPQPSTLNPKPWRAEAELVGIVRPAALANGDTAAGIL